MTKYLGRVLDPDEITVYLTTKLIMLYDHKTPSVNELSKILGKKTLTIVQKMKQRGILPGGRINLSKVDALLRKTNKLKKVLPRQTDKQVDEALHSQAKILTGILRTKILENGGGFLGKSWFGANYNIAIKMLRDDEIPFGTIQGGIKAIFDNKFYAPHCSNMHKVKDYLPKMMMHKKNDIQSVVSVADSHLDEWEEAVG